MENALTDHYESQAEEERRGKRWTFIVDCLSLGIYIFVSDPGSAGWWHGLTGN
jgi:hypothetical protein